MGKMDVDGEKLVLRDLGEEEFEEGGFSDAGLTIHEGNVARVEQVVEPGKTLGKAFVFHDKVGGDFFTERLSSHGKVCGKHD